MSFSEFAKALLTEKTMTIENGLLHIELAVEKLKSLPDDQKKELVATEEFAINLFKKIDPKLLTGAESSRLQAAVIKYVQYSLKQLPAIDKETRAGVESTYQKIQEIFDLIKRPVDLDEPSFKRYLECSSAIGELEKQLKTLSVRSVSKQFESIRESMDQLEQIYLLYDPEKTGIHDKCEYAYKNIYDQFYDLIDRPELEVHWKSLIEFCRNQLERISQLRSQINGMLEFLKAYSNAIYTSKDIGKLRHFQKTLNFFYPSSQPLKDQKRKTLELLQKRLEMLQFLESNREGITLASANQYDGKFSLACTSCAMAFISNLICFKEEDLKQIGKSYVDYAVEEGKKNFFSMCDRRIKVREAIDQSAKEEFIRELKNDSIPEEEIQKQIDEKKYISEFANLGIEEQVISPSDIDLSIYFTTLAPSKTLQIELDPAANTVYRLIERLAVLQKASNRMLGIVMTHAQKSYALVMGPNTFIFFDSHGHPIANSPNAFMWRFNTAEDLCYFLTNILAYSEQDLKTEEGSELNELIAHTYVARAPIAYSESNEGVIKEEVLKELPMKELTHLCKMYSSITLGAYLGSKVVKIKTFEVLYKIANIRTNEKYPKKKIEEEFLSAFALLSKENKDALLEMIQSMWKKYRKNNALHDQRSTEKWLLGNPFDSIVLESIQNLIYENTINHIRAQLNSNADKMRLFLELLETSPPSVGHTEIEIIGLLSQIALQMHIELDDRFGEFSHRALKRFCLISPSQEQKLLTLHHLISLNACPSALVHELLMALPSSLLDQIKKKIIKSINPPNVESFLKNNPKSDIVKWALTGILQNLPTHQLKLFLLIIFNQKNSLLDRTAAFYDLTSLKEHIPESELKPQILEAYDKGMGDLEEHFRKHFREYLKQKSPSKPDGELPEGESLFRADPFSPLVQDALEQCLLGWRIGQSY